MTASAYCRTCELSLIREEREPEDSVQGMSMINGAIESAAAHMIVHPKHQVEVTLDLTVRWNV